MKKFTLLLSFFLAALMVPCSVSNATVTKKISGEAPNQTLTFSTDQSSAETFDLSGLSSDEKACTKIVVSENVKLTGNFSEVVTCVDYPTYTLNFSSNQSVVEIVAKPGQVVALTTDGDVGFINSKCTTVVFRSQGNGVFSDLTAFTNGTKCATTVDFRTANFSEPTVLKFKYWPSITTAYCPSGIAPTDFSTDLFENCSSVSFVDFGNINMLISGSGDPKTLTISQDGSGSVLASDISRFLGTGAVFDNKNIVYDSSIKEIEYTDYSIIFSDGGRTAEIKAKDGHTANLTEPSDPAIKAINNACTTVKFSGAMGALSAFSTGTKTATTVDFSEASFVTPSNMTFKYWSETVENAICAPNLTSYGVSGDETLTYCSHLKTIDFGNINVNINSSSSQLTVSADAANTTLNSADLIYFFKSNSNLTGYLDNNTVLYGDNIAKVTFSDYEMNFSGNTVEVKNTTSPETPVEIVQKHARSTQNCTTIKFTGQFENLNTFSGSSGHSVLDFSEATISGNQYQLNQWKPTATNIIFPEGEAEIGVSVEGSSTKITIKAEDNNQTAIKTILTSWYPEGENSGEYTYEMSGMSETVNTSYDSSTNTLTIGSSEDRTLSEILGDSSLEGVSGATKIVWPDGSEYDKNTHILTTSALDYATKKSWLDNATGFNVSKIELGNKYVIIDYTDPTHYPEGLTIIDNWDETNSTSRVDELIGQNFSRNTNLTEAEKMAIKLAINLKLEGKFTNDDFLGLKNVKGGQTDDQIRPKRLDLSMAKLDKSQTLPSDWGQNSIEEIKLPEHFYDFEDNNNEVNVIPANMCENYSKITTLVIPNAITGVGENAFRGCTLLNNVTWGTGLVEIGPHAFERCGLGPIFHIPSSIKYIREDGFRDNTKLTYLYIDTDSNLERIESGAFFYDSTPTTECPGLKEVHVDCQHFIWCDVNAFDEAHTNGHTDVATAKCRLFYPPVGVSEYKPNYPEDVSSSTNNSFEDYVGNFKSALFDGVMDQSDFQTLETVVLNGTTKDGVTYGPYPGHGWYMFSSTGIGITQDTKWRTYSEALPYLVPDAAIAKFYLVCGYEASSSTVQLVQMPPNDIVRKNTGILVNYVYASDMASSDFQRVIPLTYPSTVGENDNTPYYYIGGGQYSKNGNSYDNYLCKINIDPVDIYNVYPNADNPEYRDFFFGNVAQLRKNSDYWGEDFEADIKNSSLSGWVFLRAESGSYKVNNKAYLHLPNSLTKPESGWSQGVDTNPNLADQSSGARLLGITIIDDENEQTAVKDVNKQPGRLSDDCYYTLQGQKVSSFAKGGFYIHNGKKVIVK